MMTCIFRSVMLLVWFTCLALAEQVTILGINDLHANMQRLPRMATIVREQRLAHPDLLLLSAGDHNTGDPVSDLSPVFRGWPMIDVMNRLGVDVSCIGNHEFDGGPEALRLSMEAARFPFVCANMHAPESLGLTQQPYVILERQGIRIGVLGVVTVSASGCPSLDPANMAGMSFDDPLAEAAKYKWLRDECDVLVLLTHIGYAQDRELAERFPDADVIIGGHTGTLLKDGVTEHGVLITQAGDRAEAVTKIVLDVEDGRVVSSRAVSCLVDEAKPDAEMAGVISEFSKVPALQETLAENLTELNALAAGSLIGEALREGTGADVAVINGGGIRLRRLPKGPITVADVYRLDPFCNGTVTARVTGRELEELIQKVIDRDHGRPACVAGVQYDIMSEAGRGLRVANVRLSDGRPLEPDRQYMLVTHEYVSRTVLKTLALENINTLKEDNTLTEEYLIRYLRKHGQIDFGARQNVTLPPELQERL